MLSSEFSDICFCFPIGPNSQDKLVEIGIYGVASLYDEPKEVKNYQ